MLKKIILPYTVPVDLKNEILTFVKITSHDIWDHAGINHYDKSIYEMIKIDKMNRSLQDKIREFGSFIFDDMQMLDRKHEPILDYGLIYVKDSGAVKEHIDLVEQEINYWHVRLNFLLSKPEIGGDPIIEGKIYNIQQDQSWINLANIWKHGCTEVRGEKPRVTLSIGHYVNRSNVKQFLEKLFKEKQ